MTDGNGASGENDSHNEKEEALKKMSAAMLGVFNRQVDSTAEQSENFHKSLIELAKEHKKKKKALETKKNV